MAIALVGSAVHTPDNSGGDLTESATYGSAVSVGHVGDAVVGWTATSGSDWPSGCADTLGNTWVEKTGCRLYDAGSGQATTVFACKVTTGGTPTVTVTWTGGTERLHTNMTLSFWGGLDVSGTPPADGTAAFATGTAISTGDLTSVPAGALVISSVQDVSNGTNTVTKEATATLLSDTGGTDGCFSQYEVFAAGGTIDGDFTLGTSGDALAVVRSYAAAGAGGTTLSPTGSEASAESGTPAVSFGPGIIYKLRW